MYSYDVLLGYNLELLISRLNNEVFKPQIVVSLIGLQALRNNLVAKSVETLHLLYCIPDSTILAHIPYQKFFTISNKVLCIEIML